MALTDSPADLATIEQLHLADSKGQGIRQVSAIVCYCDVCRVVLFCSRENLEVEKWRRRLQGYCPNCGVKLLWGINFRRTLVPDFFPIPRHHSLPTIFEHEKPEGLAKYRIPTFDQIPSNNKNVLTGGQSSLPSPAQASKKPDHPPTTPCTRARDRRPSLAQDGKHLQLGIAELDQLLGEIELGSFTVFYGTWAAHTLIEELCLRSANPNEASGQRTKVLYVDGGNLFDLYELADLASKLKLNRDEVLRQVYVVRAFTCYQLATIILQKLTERVEALNPKLIVIANPLELFCDPDVDEIEAKNAISQISRFLAQLSTLYQVPVIATCPPSREKRDARRWGLNQLFTRHAHVVIQFLESKDRTIARLVKHPQVSTITVPLTETPDEKRVSRLLSRERNSPLFPSCRIQ